MDALPASDLKAHLQVFWSTQSGHFYKRLFIIDRRDGPKKLNNPISG